MMVDSARRATGMMVVSFDCMFLIGSVFGPAALLREVSLASTPYRGNWAEL